MDDPIVLEDWLSERSPDERNDIRVFCIDMAPATSLPAYRCAHAGYLPLAKYSATRHCKHSEKKQSLARRIG
jgi:hypothetical protein